jgi:hypothetical protein
MDINFKCRLCDQELTAEAEGAGTEIQCPSCGGTIQIPAADPMHAAPHIVNPIATSAAAKESKHFVVPQHQATASLIEKANKPLEAAARDGITLRIKCIRHYDCVEVGKDHFDDVVTGFLNKVGENNIVKLETFNYSHRDLETRDWVTDYGLMIIYHS